MSSATPDQLADRVHNVHNAMEILRRAIDALVAAVDVFNFDRGAAVPNDLEVRRQEDRRTHDATASEEGNKSSM